MNLTYRSISYLVTQPTFPADPSDTIGTFLGRRYRMSSSNPVPQVGSPIALKFRGIQYQVNH